MIFSSLGGLRSTAVHGSNFPGGKTIVTNDEMRGLLDENLLSPIHSSELNSPTTGAPSQTWLEVARKHHKQKFKEAAVSNKSAIRVKINSLNSPIFTTFDGGDSMEMQEGFELEISRSNLKLSLLRSKETQYFNVLKDKLMWSNNYGRK